VREAGRFLAVCAVGLLAAVTVAGRGSAGTGSKARYSRRRRRRSPESCTWVEQAAEIVVVRDGHQGNAPFLDLRSIVKSGGEQGMLSMAFGYATNHLFYVDYTDVIDPRPGYNTHLITPPPK
jgi:hypothetical protein